MGTPLREILEEHAGGMQDGYELRAVLLRRRLHRLHHRHFDVPINYVPR